MEEYNDRLYSVIRIRFSRSFKDDLFSKNGISIWYLIPLIRQEQKDLISHMYSTAHCQSLSRAVMAGGDQALLTI